jgi:hypothetical protein
MTLNFSVIIPIYNRSEFLTETLASVNAQTMSPAEILVVDDGSSDKEAEKIAQIVEGAGAKLIQQENAGPGVARNRGAQEAIGSYLVFLDSDDLMVPTTLATYIEVITQTEASLLAASVSEFDQGFQPSPEIASDDQIEMSRYDDYLASSRNSEVILGAGMMVVQKDLFLVSGGFTEERINGEDHDMAIRLGTLPVFVQIVSPPTLMYRRHANSLTAQTSKTREGIEFLLKREREGYFPGGRRRASERRRILSRHVRPVSLACLRVGDLAGAWKLYRASFGVHVRQGAWKYLLSFPLTVLKTLFK